MPGSNHTRVDLFSPFLSFLQAQGSFRTAVYIVFINVEDFLPTAGQSTSSHMLRQSELTCQSNV